MKKLLLPVAAAFTLFACGDGGSKETGNVVLNNIVDSVSYSIGLDISANLKNQFPEGNWEAVLQGLKDGQDSSTTTLIPVESAQNIINPYMSKKREEEMKKQQEEYQKQMESQFGNVKEEGIKFLEENKTKEGIVVTPSGLQYEVIKEGTGNSPVATSQVTVHYHGTTPTGEVFDSSVERGEPATFGLNQVIRGWTEGLQYMKEGAKFKFYIPQELAYGANAPGGGQGPIKPFMPLVFEVELISINN